MSRKQVRYEDFKKVKRRRVVDGNLLRRTTPEQIANDVFKLIVETEGKKGEHGIKLDDRDQICFKYNRWKKEFEFFHERAIDKKYKEVIPLSVEEAVELCVKFYIEPEHRDAVDVLDEALKLAYETGEKQIIPAKHDDRFEVICRNGYITVNWESYGNNGIEVENVFHDKITMLSPTRSPMSDNLENIYDLYKEHYQEGYILNSKTIRQDAEVHIEDSLKDCRESKEITKIDFHNGDELWVFPVVLQDENNREINGAQIYFKDAKKDERVLIYEDCIGEDGIAETNYKLFYNAVDVYVMSSLNDKEMESLDDIINHYKAYKDERQFQHEIEFAR